MLVTCWWPLICSKPLLIPRASFPIILKQTMFTSISSKIPQQHNLIAELSKLWISRSRIKVCLLCLEMNEVELNDNIQILHIKLTIWRIDIFVNCCWQIGSPSEADAGRRRIRSVHRALDRTTQICEQFEKMVRFIFFIHYQSYSQIFQISCSVGQLKLHFSHLVNRKRIQFLAAACTLNLDFLQFFPKIKHY